ELNLGDRVPEGPPVVIGVRAGQEELVIELSDGAVRSRAWNGDTPDVTLTGPPRLILGVLIGLIDLEDARARGLECKGDVETLRRVVGEASSGRDVLQDEGDALA